MAWSIALIASIGSLFFSEVMRFTPCVLCWYQRIAMYPLVVLFLVAYLGKPREGYFYFFPITVIGWFIAAYHNLLHFGVIPESAAPCVQGVSCSTIYINWMGFITIPLLSFIAFSLILILMILLKKEMKNE